MNVGAAIDGRPNKRKSMLEYGQTSLEVTKSVHGRQPVLIVTTVFVYGHAIA